MAVVSKWTRLPRSTIARSRIKMDDGWVANVSSRLYTTSSSDVPASTEEAQKVIVSVISVQY